MKTYIINSPKDLDQHRDDFWIRIKGNVEINIPLWLSELPKRLRVDWSIKAGRSIKAGEYIKAGRYIKAGGYIEAGWSIEAGEYIKAGRYIKAGGCYWVCAWLSISCKKELRFWLKVFAGVCTRRGISDEDKTITCWKFEWWEVAYWILKETWIQPEKKKIIIGWKEIEISEESYEELKKSLL